MNPLAAGARRLPAHHLTIRVPWHDGGWTGCVCSRPLDNTSCLVLPRTGEGRRDDVEVRCAGQRIDGLAPDDRPPCIGERVAFMAPFPLTRTMMHPYAAIYPETHGHFSPTPFVHPPYSAACVPYRWMLREKGATIDSQLEDEEPGPAAPFAELSRRKQQRRRGRSTALRLNVWGRQACTASGDGTLDRRSPSAPRLAEARTAEQPGQTFAAWASFCRSASAAAARTKTDARMGCGLQ